jgi:hypothetical protein
MRILTNNDLCYVTGGNAQDTTTGSFVSNNYNYGCDATRPQSTVLANGFSSLAAILAVFGQGGRATIPAAIAAYYAYCATNFSAQ